MKMNRFTRIWMIILSLMMVFTIGCNRKNKEMDIHVEEGKVYLKDKEYDEALNSFNQAKAEGLEDEKIDRFIELIEDYQNALKLKEEGNIGKAHYIMENIDDDYKLTSMKEDISTLKLELKDLMEGDSESIEDLDYSKDYIYRLAMKKMRLNLAEQSEILEDIYAKDELLHGVYIEFKEDDEEESQNIYIGSESLNVYDSELNIITNLND